MVLTSELPRSRRREGRSGAGRLARYVGISVWVGLSKRSDKICQKFLATMRRLSDERGSSKIALIDWPPESVDSQCKISKKAAENELTSSYRISGGECRRNVTEKPTRFFVDMVLTCAPESKYYS